LIRVHGEYMARLAATPSDGELAKLARSRLLQLADDVRRSWRSDLAAAGDDALAERALMDRHVERSLKLVEAVATASGCESGSRMPRCRWCSSCGAWKGHRPNWSATGWRRAGWRSPPDRPNKQLPLRLCCSKR
jgi:hypothetical protein